MYQLNNYFGSIEILSILRFKGFYSDTNDSLYEYLTHVSFSRLGM